MYLIYPSLLLLFSKNLQWTAFLLLEHVHVYSKFRTAVFLSVLRQGVVTHILFTSNYKGPVLCMYHF